MGNIVDHMLCMDFHLNSLRIWRDRGVVHSTMLNIHLLIEYRMVVRKIDHHKMIHCHMMNRHRRMIHRRMMIRYHMME